MGVVWSCYKYLTQANEARARHRSLESDEARSPEDAEVQSVRCCYLIPPKNIAVDMCLVMSLCVSVLFML